VLEAGLAESNCVGLLARDPDYFAITEIIHVSGEAKVWNRKQTPNGHCWLECSARNIFCHFVSSFTFLIPSSASPLFGSSIRDLASSFYGPGLCNKAEFRIDVLLHFYSYWPLRVQMSIRTCCLCSFVHPSPWIRNGFLSRCGPWMGMEEKRDRNGLGSQHLNLRLAYMIIWMALFAFIAI
jgi:hypothetical protein